MEILTRPRAVALVENGTMLRRNMQRESITREELMSQLREHGLDDPAHVRLALMEGDGRISVVPFEGHEGAT